MFEETINFGAVKVAHWLFCYNSSVVLIVRLLKRTSVISVGRLINEILPTYIALTASYKYLWYIMRNN